MQPDIILQKCIPEVPWKEGQHNEIYNIVDAQLCYKSALDDNLKSPAIGWNDKTRP